VHDHGWHKNGLCVTSLWLANLILRQAEICNISTSITDFMHGNHTTFRNISILYFKVIPLNRQKNKSSRPTSIYYSRDSW